MEEKDPRVSEIIEAARKIENQLYEDGFAPEEVLLIATILSNAASQAMAETEEEDEEEEEETADVEPGEAPKEEDEPDYR